MFHPLDINAPIPVRFNNPFDYEPDALCRAAVRELQSKLPVNPIEGKMYGVLIVMNKGRLGYLQAYSGQIENEPEGFVPAVFDYLQPNGYFKIHEAEISSLNHMIAQLQTSEEYKEAQQQLKDIQQEAQKVLDEKRNIMQAAKALRDKRRKEAFISEQEHNEMIRQSQFLKAELHRTKLTYNEQIDAAKQRLQLLQDKITAWKRERKLKSDRLQYWLFSQFSLLNARGERKNLLDIFRDYYLLNSAARTRTAQKLSASADKTEDKNISISLLPPSGAGECCEPKLLQYAFQQGYKPIAMAMFWWGPAPKNEVRQHGSYYPACNGKCKPILMWMLEGLETNCDTASNSTEQTIEIIYEDSYLAVINKPSGLLSVPGKSGKPSVYSILKERWKGENEPFMVHRLDMSTSGLLVIARNLSVYKALQKQFLHHEVSKRYVALLPFSFLEKHKPTDGRITLPLTPDVDDRPRQMVDHINGKSAITEYHVVGKTKYGKDNQEAIKIQLHPQTGRTHQLRVHCAHKEGLDTPIIGDTLYGKRDERLWLHAEHLDFTHPITAKNMSFDSTLL